MGSIDTLRSFVDGFDLDSLGLALGDELAEELLGRYREQATFDRVGLAEILGAAARRGVARFVSCAAVEVESDGDTAAVIAVVRDALSLICTDGSVDRSVRAERATRGVHLLGQLVNRWPGGTD